VSKGLALDRLACVRVEEVEAARVDRELGVPYERLLATTVSVRREQTLP
jgi:hypothetical protein